MSNKVVNVDVFPPLLDRKKKRKPTGPKKKREASFATDSLLTSIDVFFVFFWCEGGMSSDSAAFCVCVSNLRMTLSLLFSLLSKSAIVSNRGRVPSL